MTPMFAETLNSQAADGGASQSGAMKGKLRATQASLEFSQTQATGTSCQGSSRASTGEAALVFSGVAEPSTLPENACAASALWPPSCSGRTPFTGTRRPSGSFKCGFPRCFKHVC